MRGASLPARYGMLLFLLLIAASLAGCAVQRIRDAANERISEGGYEQALVGLEAGLKSHPESAELRSALVVTRSEAVTRLLAQAASARAQGKLEAAQGMLDRALALEPGNLRVRDLIQSMSIEQRLLKAGRLAEELAAKGQITDALRHVNEGLKDSPRHVELLALQRDLERRQRQGKPSGGRALSEARPVSMDFRDAALRTVLDVVSRNSGVSFVLDKDVRAETRITVYLKQGSVEEALELIVTAGQLAKKVLDERTVLVYPNTADKLREHQDQVIRVFYLANADAKGASAFLKSMLKLRDPFVDERTNMLAVREAPETVALAERLISIYDTGEPEVMLDLEVLEIGSNRLTDLGIKFPDTLSLTPLPLAGATGLTLSSLRSIGEDRVGVSVAGLLLNLKRQAADFEILANPRIRAKHREKAKVLIGNKVPVITTTTSQNGFVSDNVNYLDVGLKLDLEPTVYADDDVSIKVALEVSSLANQIKTGNGLIAYEIQTRNASTTLRLRDGETQVLAGLISREQRTTANRLPGAGDIPVLGRIFSTQLDNGQRSELVLAITPRVIRNVRRLDAHESEIWIGPENQPRLRANQPSQLPANPGSPASLSVAPSGATLGAASVARGTSSEVGAPALQPTPSALAGLSRVQLSGPSSVRVGQEFTVLATLASSGPFQGATLQLKFDEQQASLYQVVPGGLMSRDGSGVDVRVDPVAGGRMLNIASQAMPTGPGQGVAALLRFRAMRAGRWELNLQSAGITGAGTQGTAGVAAPITVGAPLLVEVLP